MTPGRSIKAVTKSQMFGIEKKHSTFYYELHAFYFTQKGIEDGRKTLGLLAPIVQLIR